jgi:hypothetical protein
VPLLPGRPHALRAPATVDQLVAFCDLQAGRGGWLAEALPVRPPSAEEVVHAVTWSATTASSGDCAFVGGADQVDIVHFDSRRRTCSSTSMSGFSALSTERRPRRDRLFDLATQLFYAPSDGEVHSGAAAGSA